VRLSSSGARRSISQVYELLLEAFDWTGGTPQALAYDDMCHMGKYMFNPVRADAENVTPQQRLLATTLLAVDPFHFRGHKDQHCTDYYDPGKISKLRGVNMEVRARQRHQMLCIQERRPRTETKIEQAIALTHSSSESWALVFSSLVTLSPPPLPPAPRRAAQACEQTFSSMSRFKHMATKMNKAHFMFFLLDMMDTRNTQLAKRLTAPSAAPQKWIPVSALEEAAANTTSAPYKLALVRAHREAAPERAACRWRHRRASLPGFA